MGTTVIWWFSGDPHLDINGAAWFATPTVGRGTGVCWDQGPGEPLRGAKMRILLAIDESKFSEAAIQTVKAWARVPGTEVRVIHVVEPPAISIPSMVAGSELGQWSASELEALWRAQVAEAEALLAKAAAALKEAGCDVVSGVEEGDPKSRIIDVAAEWHADLVVVGSHGRKGLDRFLLGSVSEAVARHAPCSVEIVRIRA